MKVFFLTRSLREKMFMLGLIAIAAAMWLSSVSGRTHTFFRQVSDTSTDLAVQKRWLSERAHIETDAKNAIANLDPARTFDSVRLQAELDAIAHQVGLSKDNNIDDPQVVPGTQFTLNSVRFVVRNAEWTVLEKFYTELTKRAPYIGIDEFSILPSSKANPAQLTASLRVTSVQIAH